MLESPSKDLCCLAIETSCDDTSLAIMDSHGFVLGQVQQSQDLFHAPFAGVVPEIAYRQHAEALLPLLDKLLNQTGLDWSQIGSIAVTDRPGLLGSLMVGLVTGRSLAFLLKKPLIGVNHLHGHIAAPFLSDSSYKPPFASSRPHLCLAVSGGHTSLYLIEGPRKPRILGSTRDDAAGECLDKIAQRLGLGFPGGAKLDALSRTAVDFRRYQFAKTFQRSDFNFSFSGLKAAAVRKIQELGEKTVTEFKAEFAASFEYEVVQQLVIQTEKAIRETGVQFLTVTGGVSANSLLRKQMQDLALGRNITLAIPPLKYCTDNAAMIAGVRTYGPTMGLEPRPLGWSEGVSASSAEGDFL